MKVELGRRRMAGGGAVASVVAAPEYSLPAASHEKCRGK